MTPAEYTRKNRQWKQWIGRPGVVVAVTQIHVAPPDQALFAPYSYCIVDFGSEKKSLMGVAGETLTVGDEVVCVLRKIAIPDEKGIIPYGIKVKKI